MDVPTSGSLAIGGVRVSGLGDDRLTDLRRRRIGFVFQFFNLLPTLTALENISLPLLLTGEAPAQALTISRTWPWRTSLAPST